MKNYDVYALGNALVDIEYHVETKDLISMGVEKGVMTLIDNQRQNHLVNYLGDSHEKMACGGSVANSAIAIAQMGGQGFFSCRVADDIEGQFYLDGLKKAGIKTNSHLYLEGAGVTGTCLAFVTPDADRSMNTYLGVSAGLNDTYVSELAIQQSEYIYMEGYLVSEEHSREAVLRAKSIAKQNKVKTALTLSDPTMITFFREGMLEIIGDGFDLIFSNEDEANELCGGSNLDETIEKMKQYARTFAITLGERGSIVFDGSKLIEIPPYPVEAIDTLGAGDMFAGAFLYGLTHSMDFRQSGQLASMASSKIVTQFGAKLEAQQILDILYEFKNSQ